MSVISITVTESEEQIIDGIPRRVALSTNIPAVIFYTLDGSDPNLTSLIYITPIEMPTNVNSLILKAWATNGTSNSDILSIDYTVSMLQNLRRRAATTQPPSNSLHDPRPFGDQPRYEGQVQYLNPGDAGFNVYDPSLPAIPNAFDADGYPTAFSNLPYNLTNYDIVFTSTDSNNESIPGVGTLPDNVKIEPPNPPPDFSEQSDKLFDPRAYVIYHDVSKENPDDPPFINRQFFILEDPTSRDGGFLFNGGAYDGPAPSGSFVRSSFNPKDNTMTFYYRDNVANKWIISTAPYTPKPEQSNLNGMILSKNSGAGFVFEWHPFSRRYLM